jgi:hypothetical protein
VGDWRDEMESCGTARASKYVNVDIGSADVFVIYHLLDPATNVRNPKLLAIGIATIPFSNVSDPCVKTLIVELNAVP